MAGVGGVGRWGGGQEEANGPWHFLGQQECGVSIILDPLDYGLSQVVLTFIAEVPRELQEPAQGQAAFKCTLLHGL